MLAFQSISRRSAYCPETLLLVAAAPPKIHRLDRKPMNDKTTSKRHDHGGSSWLITPRQFAIRPTIRNHHTMKRDDIIKQVADLVGKPHTVDLKHYDRLILVDVYRVSTMSSSPEMAYRTWGLQTEPHGIEYSRDKRCGRRLREAQTVQSGGDI